MTKGEIETLKNIILRLQQPNLGCSHGPGRESLVLEANSQGLHVTSDVYLNTWIISSLEMLLPGPHRDVDLAVRMSRC